MSNNANAMSSTRLPETEAGTARRYEVWYEVMAEIAQNRILSTSSSDTKSPGMELEAEFAEGKILEISPRSFVYTNNCMHVHLIQLHQSQPFS